MCRSERGAVTIHVAIALVALLMFSGMTIDYGVMWVARRQAQNAADAGALAGASTLLVDPSAIDEAKIVAKDFVNLHGVWGQAVGNGNINVEFPVQCPDTSTTCLRVDAMR